MTIISTHVYVYICRYILYMYDHAHDSIHMYIHYIHVRMILFMHIYVHADVDTVLPGSPGRRRVNKKVSDGMQF